MTDSDIITSATLRVPCRALNTVCSSWFKVIKLHRGVSGVEFEARVGSLSDDDQCVEDGVLHWVPGHKDGAIGRRGCVQVGSHYNCRCDQGQKLMGLMGNKNKQTNKETLLLLSLFPFLYKI